MLCGSQEEYELFSSLESALIWQTNQILIDLYVTTAGKLPLIYYIFFNNRKKSRQRLRNYDIIYILNYLIISNLKFLNQISNVQLNLCNYIILSSLTRASKHK